jgi:glycosyltransferase involved in cell wall biosynthesis
VESFERLSLNGELIIVNDGSRDRTGEIAAELAESLCFVKVLHHSASQGIGAAFRDALQVACGEMVVYIPGDGEIDAAEILRYIPLMADVDLVVPYVQNPEIRRWSRRFLSACYTRIMGRTFSVPLRYLNGTVMYRRAILDGITIRNPGFFYQAELLIKTIRRNYLYVEVPYVQQRRMDGKSKSVTFKAFKAVLNGYFVLIAELFFLRCGYAILASLSITTRKQQKGMPLATDKHS